MRLIYAKFLRWSTIHGMRRWWIRDVTGIHHVPGEGPCLVIANHASYLDFLILSSIFELNLGHILRFWVGERIARHWFFRHYCELARCLAVTRGSIRCAWEESVRCLTREKDFICIFPEGTRTRNGRLQEFKTGYLRLAAECGAPMLPVCLENTYNAWPPHRTLPRLRKVDIHFFQPIRIPPGLSLAELRELNAAIRAQSFRADPEHRFAPAKAEQPMPL